MEEICLGCKWCENIDCTGKGFLGETLLQCEMCEEETENKELCFEKKVDLSGLPIGKEKL